MFLYANTVDAILRPWNSQFGLKLNFISTIIHRAPEEIHINYNKYGNIAQITGLEDLNSLNPPDEAGDDEEWKVQRVADSIVNLLCGGYAKKKKEARIWVRWTREPRDQVICVHSFNNRNAPET